MLRTAPTIQIVVSCKYSCNVIFLSLLTTFLKWCTPLNQTERVHRFSLRDTIAMAGILQLTTWEELAPDLDPDPDFSECKYLKKTST